MVDYVRLAATAKRLIEANGREVTLYRRQRTPSDSTKAWRGASRTTPPEASMGPVKVAFVPAGGSGSGEVFLGFLLAQEGEQETKVIRQVGLLAVDSVAALSPPPAELDPGRYDHLVDGERPISIARVAELRPGDVALIYVLGLSG